MDFSYRELYHLATYDVDREKKMDFLAICRYFQEAAGNHADKLGLSVTNLRSRGLTWMLSRIMVQVLEYPEHPAEIRVTTWPRGFQGLFALRDFIMEVRRQDHYEPIAKATSSWLVFDYSRKRPVPAVKALPDFADFISDTYAKVTPVLERNAGKIQFPEKAAQPEGRVRVGYRDLDINDHVNNLSYYGWFIDATPPEYLFSKRIAEGEVNFLLEARFHEQLDVYISKQEEEDAFYYCLSRDQIPVATAWYRWTGNL